MLNKVQYDHTISFIFSFCWFGPFWRLDSVDFSDNHLFYPLEMVENTLIRAWQGSLNDFKGIIRLSPTQQHHLWSSFNNLNALREKYSLIFTINTIFTPWMNRKCLISAQISIKKDPVWLKCREYHQNQLFKSKKMGQKLFILDNFNDISRKIVFYPLIWDKSRYPGNWARLPTSVFGFFWCPIW